MSWLSQSRKFSQCLSLVTSKSQLSSVVWCLWHICQMSLSRLHRWKTVIKHSPVPRIVPTMNCVYPIHQTDFCAVFGFVVLNGLWFSITRFYLLFSVFMSGFIDLQTTILYSVRLLRNRNDQKYFYFVTLTLQTPEMSTGYTWPSRSNLHFFLTFGYSRAQSWVPECPNASN